jgi:hypothetical protein
MIAALLFAGITFLINLTFKPFRENRQILLAVSLTVFAHQTVVFADLFATGLFAFLPDAATLHEQAIALKQSEGYQILNLLLKRDHEFYQQLLATLYRWGEPHVFLGRELSVLAFSLSNCVFYRLIEQCGQVQWAAELLLLYGLLPSGLMHGSLTLRESFQGLALLILSYQLMKFRIRHDLRQGALLLLAIWFLAIWHKGLLLFSTGILIWLLWQHFGGIIKTGLKKNWSSRDMVRVVIIFFLLLSLYPLVQLIDAIITKITVDGIWWNAYEAARSRAFYGMGIRTDSLFGRVVTLPLALIYYWLAPMPWQITKWFDLYALLENSWRLVLLGCSFYALKMAGVAQKRNQAILLGTYFGVELIWAIGTLNWGTAMRHHLPAYGLVLLAGYPTLRMSLKKLLGRGKMDIININSCE